MHLYHVHTGTARKVPNHYNCGRGIASSVTEVQSGIVLAQLYSQYIREEIQHP